MSLPILAAAVVATTYLMSHGSSKKLAAQMVTQQTPGGRIASLGHEHLMHVDKAQNTSLRNDAIGDSPAEISAHLKRTYASEAATHPGVRLVAASAFA